MDWRRGRRSSNVQRADGRPAMRAGAPLGLGGLALVVVLGLALGQSPVEILGLLLDASGGSTRGTSTSSSTVAVEQSEQVEFVRAILGSSEDVWGEAFGEAGREYPAPQLILFSGSVRSACGHATSAVGPFYCPGDRQIYLDLDFFREMEERFDAAGDMARAYVIAHEVGHHIQNITGTMDRVRQARGGGRAMEGADGLSVRQELQADCYAGVWARRSNQRLRWLEPGDVESAIGAASAIGDDALQNRAQGFSVPDSFTHGSSKQRVRWFQIGLADGNVDDCDTFRVKAL